MKRMRQQFGFTLIELLATLVIIGVFCVVLTQVLCVETRLSEDAEAMICIHDEERYVSEFLFETLYSVEKVDVTDNGASLPLSAFDFSYVTNSCPILGYRGEKTIRFVQEGSQLQIWELYHGYPQIKKAIAYHITNASCEMVQNAYSPSKPLLHITLFFEAGHIQKSYDLLFAMRNLS